MQLKQERTLQVVVFIVIAAIALYFGYRLFEKWHRAEIDTAVESERQQWNRQAEKLIGEIDKLQRQVDTRLEPEMAEEKDRPIPGEKVIDTSPATKKQDCEKLERQVTAFFEYLDERNYVNAYALEKKTLALFREILGLASQSLPVNTGETRDILTLLHNMAHFYRTFGKKNCLLIKDVLAYESEFMEPVLATFFAYFFRNNDCKNRILETPPFEVFYNYAGFFLNTIGGRSYLFRRNSRIRTLFNYYGVLILDRANDTRRNHYGIDIRPFIDSSIYDISNHKGLQNRRQYLDRLNRIKAKY